MIFKAGLPLLAATLLLAMGCATSGRAPQGERAYTESIDEVVTAASDAVVEAGYNIEEQNWLVPQIRYRIIGYELARAFNDPEGLVRTATFTIDIEASAPGRVEVAIRSASARTPAMASSADPSNRVERTIFSLLEDRLTPAEGIE